jgi:hypothetical protein
MVTSGRFISFLTRPSTPHLHSGWLFCRRRHTCLTIPVRVPIISPGRCAGRSLQPFCLDGFHTTVKREPDSWTPGSSRRRTPHGNYSLPPLPLHTASRPPLACGSLCTPVGEAPPQKTTTFTPNGRLSSRVGRPVPLVGVDAEREAGVAVSAANLLLQHVA